MYNICIFAGTTEGRKLTEFLSGQPAALTACVATEYGEAMIKSSENLTILAERLSFDEMKELFSKAKFDLVIDATHPYAVEATKNISSACRETGTEYIRLARDHSNITSEVVFVSDAEEAAEFLDKTQGNILITTGSKEITKFAEIHDFENRIYARVLPNTASIQACADAGMKPAHIIAMQGPFSEEMNIAMLKAVSAEYIVTKDGGSPGGFDAKISAAVKSDVRIIVIGRPQKESGLCYSQVIDLLCDKFGFFCKPEVSIAGIGPGNADNMTSCVMKTVSSADCIIGAKRMLEAFDLSGRAVFESADAKTIADFIKSHHEYGSFAVLMSGDTGFFSGTKKLIPLLSDCKVNVLPGISSLAYLCSKLHKSYEDVKTVSLHGRDYDIVSCVRKENSVFALTGGGNDVKNVLNRLTNAGLGNVKVYIGERLGCGDEKITCGRASELADGAYDKLSSLLIENESADFLVSYGLPDDAFLRNTGDNKLVPMTKSEVRSVCLSKLMLTERAVCWDIGAGTGSVSVEMALKASKGKVYAIEYKENAIELIKKNAEKFSLDNIIVADGKAPEACEILPAPTHAFIGGSSGNMKEIISLLLEKNPHVRIVAAAVSLETVSELANCMKEFGFDKAEAVSLAVSRSEKAGDYNLMKALNPVYIFTMQNGGGKA